MEHNKPRLAKISVISKALAILGPGWALARGRIALLTKLGLLERRTPLQHWGDLPLPAILKEKIPSEDGEYFKWRRNNSPPFFCGQIDEGETFVGKAAIPAAEQILRGTFPFFSGTQFLGFPPAWQTNPFNQTLAPGGHWSRIDEFAAGDIKIWWESSRFSWVFTLGRAYVRNGDERYPEAFWQLLESWLDQNPPHWGINWKCGQEASFRAMALCFGFYVFLRSVSSTPDRVARFIAAIAIHGKRINAHIGYAQSQKNNHGLSEATALWTIGILFPEIEGAQEWRERGRRGIEREVRRQIYADGSYVQHSTNYHRVMLHDLAWALRLGECNQDGLAPDIYESFRKSIDFLYALTDPQTGWAPNYGANDGALVLPLSDCEYPDMRAVLQACHYIAEKHPLYPPGPWDEEMVWMNGIDSLKKSRFIERREAAAVDAAEGGCYTIRSDESWAMFKAAKYKDRPSHADQLHVDLWWRGVNVVCDAGTYSYNSDFPFEHGFASTRYHNTVTVDGLDQMTRLGRFLWADWAAAHVHGSNEPSLNSRCLAGDHDGYAKVGVIHRRAVAGVSSGAWIVVDDLIGRGQHELRLQWLMPNAPLDVAGPGAVDLSHVCGKVRLLVLSSGECSFDLVRAGERIDGSDAETADPARGWVARYYARKEPALSFMARSRAFLPVRFITIVMLADIQEVTILSPFRSLLIGSERIDLSSIGEWPISVRKA